MQLASIIEATLKFCAKKEGKKGIRRKNDYEEKVKGVFISFFLIFFEEGDGARGARRGEEGAMCIKR